MRAVQRYAQKIFLYVTKQTRGKKVNGRAFTMRKALTEKFAVSV
jgi:hypothetical protein